MKCHNCGKELTDGGFCIYCGFPREEKKRASSGKLYYAAAAAVAVFTVAAASLVLLLSRAPSGKAADGAETNKYVESPSYEIAETAEAGASIPNNEAIFEEALSLLEYIKENYDPEHENGIDRERIINTDKDLLEKIYYEWPTNPQYDISILEWKPDIDGCLIFLNGYNNGAVPITIQIAWPEKEKYIMETVGEELLESFLQRADSAAVKKVIEYYSSNSTSSGGTVDDRKTSLYESVVTEKNIHWCASVNNDEEMLNKYLLSSDYKVENGEFGVYPICFFYSEDSDVVYLVLSVENGKDANGKWDIERENTSDGLRIKYKFFHGQGTADQSGKNIKSCKRVITVLECSKAEWPLPDSWKDGPLEISIVPATNEGSD